MATPLSYQKVSTPSGVLTIPIYAPTDVSYPALRIQTPQGIGCYDLIEATTETPLRINTPLGIRGVNTSENSGDPVEAVNLVDYTQVAVTNPSVVTIVSNNTEYIQLITPNNGHGATFNISEMEVGKSYSVKATLEILQSVDDRITVHVRNTTKNVYLATSLFTSEFLLNQTQNLSGTFSTTSTNYTVGDTVQLQVVQSWRNSTHDNPFEFRVYSDISVS
jgi:hypothetical protein